MGKIKNFFKRHMRKLVVSSAFAPVSVLSTVKSFAAEGEYTINTIPSNGTFDLATLGNLWQMGASMIIDVINIIASQPLLVMLVIALPLVGLGIGLFSRIKHA